MQFNQWTSWTSKYLDYLPGLELTLWYNALGFQKSIWTILLGLDWFYDVLRFMYWGWTWRILGLPYRFGLILCYIGLKLEKPLDYVAGLEFILLYIVLGLIKLVKQRCSYKSMKTLLKYQQSNPISLG